ncbi:fucose 4-O-acetylase [Paenibacillus yonginensis]|uniref:Fucose 4-O-acetylase n=1 Tax=Paenibacillus yonginensis TaxID=1462996 RepID=A0A1B1N1Y7_9BACL|nr:fucose 4-O-acetylase [Paenibacillus yonginensis]ANS75423.1 fucose 4-O-acetylase [Paenibacillus yonginensis]
MNNATKVWREESYFLNLRFLLIVCVFVGNAIEPLITRMPGLHAVYVWIFTFHMPLFVFVTGYFAKSNLRGRAGTKVLAQIALQYLIFQSLYSALDITVFKVDGIHHSFFAPYLLLWFLASHWLWRAAALTMSSWSRRAQLGVSLILGIAVGYLVIDGTWFSLSRTFVYLPFFLAGYHFRPEYIVKFFTPGIRAAACSVSLLLLAAAYLWGHLLLLGWLYGSMTYSQLGAYTWYAGLGRLGLYALQLCASAAFLSFVPLYACRITELGRRTLYVFLLHGLIVRFAAASPLYAYLDNLGGTLAIIAAAVLLTILLCQSWVRTAVSPIIEPQVEWLFSRVRKPRPAPGIRIFK